ncbi:unnamed protein product [Caenorhabditis auriculariae]|uniref:Uncharacterized protein n=1 Tax=Caenorhabditis auriculariae TaxID=2777116 RepID=A0A8S1HHE9_9PELO|nr:unnamed protein product [Caenorhabditis auriculariae]
MCKTERYRNALRRAAASKLQSDKGLTAERLETLSKHSKDGFIEEEADVKSESKTLTEEDPFEELPTRSPPTERKSYRRKYKYGRYQQYGYQYQPTSNNALLYRVYPGQHPKDDSYCSDMRGMFAYTCQPSKPLRIDLVEFCKDYAVFCNVPNFHRLPGPRMGPPIGDRSVGHVDVNGHFGFGVGSVPGLEVGVGWGVDVGPLPGVGESVGVGIGLDLGILGSKSPEAFRRGQDDPNEKGGGIVGINGGVGVKAPGTGGIGVGSGLGVGK